MPPRYAAAVSCPSCGTRFQTPVEQILDVRVDPNVTSRVLSGVVNVAQCPSCGTGGALNLPFIYHDPDREIALLYLPVEAGPNEVERQRAAGRLTRQLMDAMPPEEKKGYLLQPETFIALDTLVKRVLELEGVTEEEMARSQEQRELVAKLLQTPQEEWPEMVAANAGLIDEGLFAFLEYVAQLSQASAAQEGEEEEASPVVALHEYLVQQTEAGRELAARADVVRGFSENPNAETLLDALTKAEDDETLSLLVQSGIQLMDYGFFQQLVGRIDEATGEEAEALQTLRRRILELRDGIVEAGEASVRERAMLLGRLASTEDPVRMANSHLSELDDLFFTVLGAQMQEAQRQGDQTAIADLQRVAEAVNRVMESTMPPEIALTRRLMAAPTEEVLNEQLQAVRELLTPAYLQFLESLESSMREQDQEESVAKIALIRAKAAQIAPAAAAASPTAPSAGPVITGASPTAAPQAPEPPQASDGEQRTPSGLIIAKR